MVSRLVDVKMDAKRRVALPRQFLEGIEPPTRLVAHMDGPGRFVIETPEAAVAAAAQRIWAGLDPVVSDYDGTADVRAMRHEDARIADANAVARNPSGDSETQDDEASRRLLTDLGLTGE